MQAWTISTTLNATFTERIEIGDLQQSSLASMIEQNYQRSKIVVFMDDHTQLHCSEYLLTHFDLLRNAELIVIPPGEEHKTIDICVRVWEAFLDYQITRHDLVINLGGGVVTDMGGFIASVFKRGVNFINIPTSLLGMVDASFGGKTGVNLLQFKNPIGVFQQPVATYIDKRFLATLPSEQIKNGMAEIAKHALIRDAQLWEQLITIKDLSEIITYDILQRSVKVKMDIVQADPNELGIRKILNFGHTVGHAIEGYFLTQQRLSHGHAVALGMIAESFIALQMNLISENVFCQINKFVKKWFDVPKVNPEDIPKIMELLYNDKKNFNGQIQCSLINKIGDCLYDQAISEQMFSKALIELFFA